MELKQSERKRAKIKMALQALLGLEKHIQAFCWQKD